jgi:hypothetical protein
VVSFDVLQSFHVPAGSQVESGINFAQASDEELIQWACTTSYQAIGDNTHVVTDVTSALGLAFSSRSKVRALLLGGVGVLLIHRVSSTINQLLGVVGQSASCFHASGSAFQTTANCLQFAVAQKTALSICCGNCFGNRGLHVLDISGILCKIC